MRLNPDFDVPPGIRACLTKPIQSGLALRRSISGMGARKATGSLFAYGADATDEGVFTSSMSRQFLKRRLAGRVGDRWKVCVPTGGSSFEKASRDHSQAG